MLYEYQCAEHGRFERHFPTIREAAAHIDHADCPECGKPGDRLLSAPAVKFSGSGFYATEYAGR
jgi:putative FmdB family regulatory protein